MGRLEVRTYPDPCLRIKTKKAERFDRELERTLRSMADIMYMSQGIGLAATQVGLGLSILVVDAGDGLLDLVNPVILEESEKKDSMEEGCLSLPGALVNIKRPESIKVRAQDKNGEFFIKKFDGLTSRAVQHEIDHLNGRLIIDHLDPIRRFIASRKLTGARGRSSGRTCEVACDDGKEHTRGA